MQLKLSIASDHAGFCLKEEIKKAFPEIEWNDFGSYDQNAVDYPDTGKPAAEAVAKGIVERGILICGSGIGMSIVANRFKGVRAALCWTPEIAELSRRHNDSNILVLAGRYTSSEDAITMVKVWLQTEFEGGRHQRRIEKIDKE